LLESSTYIHTCVIVEPPATSRLSGCL